jgi:hypothetical protein
MAIREKEDRKRVIDLTGPEGNAYCILAAALGLTRQLKEVNSDLYDWDRINVEMTSDNYEHLISVFDDYFGDYVDLER